MQPNSVERQAEARLGAPLAAQDIDRCQCPGPRSLSWTRANARPAPRPRGKCSARRLRTAWRKGRLRKPIRCKAAALPSARSGMRRKRDHHVNISGRRQHTLLRLAADVVLRVRHFHERAQEAAGVLVRAVGDAQPVLPPAQSENKHDGNDQTKSVNAI